MPSSKIKPVRIDLRDTLEPVDRESNSWVKYWDWLSPIHERGFTEFEVIDWSVRCSLGRSIGVVTIIDDLSGWYDIEFVIESVRRSERAHGVEGYAQLCRAAGISVRLDDPERLVGKRVAVRVISAQGDVEFRSLSGLDAPTEFRGFLRRVAA